VGVGLGLGLGLGLGVGVVASLGLVSKRGRFLVGEACKRDVRFVFLARS
jgi:hypothetical protein